MKTIKSFIRKSACAAAIVSLGMGAVSCNDLLDTKPQGVISSEQIGEDAANSLMTAAYATLLCHYFGNNESFAGPINNWVMDVRSDDALKGGGGTGMEGYIHDLEVGVVRSNCDVVEFKWRNNYYSISRCNNAIKAIASAGGIDDAAKASYIAEMKTLRAYYYFDMYRLYQKFPYIDENVNPSEVRADAYTRAEMLGFIKKDLEDSYKVLPEKQALVGRFNRYVAAALMAKVCLFDSDWANVEKYADYVIASGQYSLYPNFLDISKPEMNNQYESVMAIQFSSANEPEQFNFCNCLNCTYSEGNLYGPGDDFYLASQDLVNSFRTDANGLPYLDGSQNSESILSADYPGNIDPRLDFTVGRIGMPWRGYEYNENWCRLLELYGQYSGKKPYPSPTNPEVTPNIVPWGASSLNYIIIRYADVMLMKAEALIEQGNKTPEESWKLVNAVRQRAANSVDPNYTPVDINPMKAHYFVGQYPMTDWTQDYARKAVRHERRIELAMEGNRWFDLLRWGNVVEVVNKYYQFEKDFQDYYLGANLSPDALYFPVPLSQKDNAHGLYD